MKKLNLIFILLMGFNLILGQSHIHSIGLYKSETIYSDNWVATLTDVDADSSRITYKYTKIGIYHSYIMREIVVLFSVLTLPEDCMIDSVFVGLYCISTTSNVKLNMRCDPDMKFNILDLYMYNPFYLNTSPNYISTGWNTFKYEGSIAKNTKYPTYMSFRMKSDPDDTSSGVESSTYFYLFHSTLKPILTIYYTTFTPSPKKIKILGVI